MLSIDADGARTFVYLKNGVPVFAEEGTSGETLGRMLVRQRMLTQEQHAEVIAKMTDALVLNEQLRFGEVAVELGFLSEEQVRKALQDQVRWKIVRCFQRPQVAWSFEDSEARLEDVGNFPMRVEALVLAALRWLEDEHKAELGLKRFLELTPVLTDAAAEIATRFELSAEERRFVEAIDGRRDTKSLLAGSEARDVDGPALVTALVVTRAIAEAMPAPSRGAAPLARPATPLQEIPIRQAPASPPARPPLQRPYTPAQPLARPATPGQAAPLARPATPPNVVPTSARPTLKESSSTALLDDVAPAAPLVERVPLSSKSPTAAPRGAASPPPMVAAPTLQRPATGAAFAPGRPPPKSRASQILAALEQQRVKADPGKAPETEHEAKLLAERAYQAGLVHIKAGRWTAAAPEMQRAAQLVASSDEYKLYAKYTAIRARSNELPHKMERAEVARLALAAVKTDPNFAFGYYLAGNMAMLDEEIVQAHRLLARAVKLDPENLDAQRLLRVVERRVKGGSDPGEGGGLLGKKLW